jgi:CRP-like cAMP-binding protein
MADPKIARLRQVGLFARCSDAELRMLARSTDEVDLPAGRTLITAGKSNDTFYLLLEGTVNVQAATHERALGPGDVFGEISMLDRGLATATVTTQTPIRALIMSHPQFRDAIRGQSSIAEKVIAVMAERLRSDQQTAL